jgi:RNA polymerase sigma-70 factor (sigma-E family)
VRQCNSEEVYVAWSRSEFEEFAIAATPSLLRVGYLLTGDQHLAEDLVQAALSRTYRSWRALDDTGNAHAYARKVMYHLQVAWWRRKRVAERLYERPVDGVIEDVSSEIDLKLSLRQALDQLTAKQRAIVVLRFFEDRSLAETAAVLECTEGTVKKQTFRALARLRAVLPNLTELTTGGS